MSVFPQEVFDFRKDVPEWNIALDKRLNFKRKRFSKIPAELANSSNISATHSQTEGQNVWIINGHPSQYYPWS